jgi:hypothetical protein
MWMVGPFQAPHGLAEVASPITHLSDNSPCSLTSCQSSRLVQERELTLILTRHLTIHPLILLVSCTMAGVTTRDNSWNSGCAEARWLSGQGNRDNVDKKLVALQVGGDSSTTFACTCYLAAVPHFHCSILAPRSTARIVHISYLAFHLWYLSFRSPQDVGHYPDEGDSRPVC